MKWLLLLLTSMVGFSSWSQEGKEHADSYHLIPGPANLDTSRFAHIYFFREVPDDFPDNYLGVVINDDLGMCVKAKMNAVYRVNTLRQGRTSFWASIQGSKREVLLDLEPGQDYFVEVRPVREPDQKIVPFLQQLDEASGRERLNRYPGAVQNRYCILPFEGNHDFTTNAWSDSVRWYAHDTYEYVFRPLPSWELLMRSTLRNAFAFRNEQISNTYSEAGGIMYLSMSRFKDESDFEDYCTNRFVSSTIERKDDSMRYVKVRKVEVPSHLMYARLVEVESSDTKSDAENVLITRSAYVVFFWQDEKGKGTSACLYISERGLSQEIHTREELERRLLWCWDGFRLSPVHMN